MMMHDPGSCGVSGPCLGCETCAGHAVQRSRDIIARVEINRQLIANTRAETRRWLTWRDRIYRGEVTG